MRNETLAARGEKIKVRNTGYKKKGELFRHIDSTGTERAILSSVWTHSEHKKPGVKKLVAALNSIKRYAKHSEYPERFVGLSENNIVIIFEGDKIYTFILKENAKKALEYFKNTTNPDEREIIKCENSLFTFLKNMIGL